MRYFLIGYMGSGKSYQGRLLAEKRGVRFIDLDAYIAEQEQKTISELFAESGENAFRILESRYLRQVCENDDNFVLSTGGGTPCYNGNMEYMNRRGHTIFLDIPVETLIQRLIKNKHQRPLISRMTDMEIGEYVPKHLNERLVFYRQAQETITHY